MSKQTLVPLSFCINSGAGVPYAHTGARSTAQNRYHVMECVSIADAISWRNKVYMCTYVCMYVHIYVR